MNSICKCLEVNVFVRAIWVPPAECDFLTSFDLSLHLCQRKWARWNMIYSDLPGLQPLTTTLLEVIIHHESSAYRNACRKSKLAQEPGILWCQRFSDCLVLEIAQRRGEGEKREGVQNSKQSTQNLWHDSYLAQCRLTWTKVWNSVVLSHTHVKIRVRNVRVRHIVLCIEVSYLSPFSTYL